MSKLPKILNEREFLRSKKELVRLRAASTNDYLLKSLQDGVPPEVIRLQNAGIDSMISKLQEEINLYEGVANAKSLSYEGLAASELGKIPIVARILLGFSQKEMAEKLGLKEQQLQRYEAEIYSSMKLSTFTDLIENLGIKISAAVTNTDAIDTTKHKFLSKKQLNFVRTRNWFEQDITDFSDEDVEKLIREMIFSSGKKVSSGVLLKSNRFRDRHAKSTDDEIWLARVVSEASQKMDSIGGKFDYLRLDYIPSLLSLSLLSNGPIQAIEKLNDLGLIVVVEPQMPGMAVDGAAILVSDVPVIALTIRHDRIDNFWFTLLHELGHIHLHHAKGLDAGFIDNFDNQGEIEVEDEANQFASESIISTEKWRFSPARLAKNAEPIERLAKNIGIHPALLFGKVRKERGFNLFNDKVGNGKVRNLFYSVEEGSNA